MNNALIIALLLFYHFPSNAKGNDNLSYEDSTQTSRYKWLTKKSQNSLSYVDYTLVNEKGDTVLHKAKQNLLIIGEVAHQMVPYMDVESKMVGFWSLSNNISDIKPQYKCINDSIYSFNTQAIIALQNPKTSYIGLINTQEKTVLSFIHDICVYIGNFYIVHNVETNFYACYNLRGQLILKEEYDHIHYFGGKVLLAYKKDKIHLYDAKGKKLNTPTFDYVFKLINNSNEEAKAIILDKKGKRYQLDLFTLELIRQK